MPTFSAVALDRLLEPGASRSTSTTIAAPSKKDVPDPSPRLERRNTTPFPSDILKSSTKRRDISPPHPQLSRRNAVDFTVAPEKKTPSRPQISPALYATPESTPLPDSPTFSYPPSSPFIINHKRRGPRLLKSSSEQNVGAAASKEDGGSVKAESELVICHTRSFSEEDVPREREGFEEEIVNGQVLKNREIKINGSTANQEVEMNGFNGDVMEEKAELKEVIGLSLGKDSGDTEDFFDPQESMSFASNTDVEDYSAERSAKTSTSMGEFFDASEELSSDSGCQRQRSLADVEAELREMRLSLLMEIEKRKQAEESLSSMRSQWQILRQKLGAVGLILPAYLSVSLDDIQSDVDPTEDVCRQIHLACFVSESIGRGIAKAEAEAEMEAQLEVKNFEIARLCDRLHYYETMNREMCHRNQEAIEIARHERQKRRMRQKWIWGSIAAAITLGSAALAWSFIPSGQGSSSTSSLEVPESDRDGQ